MIIIKELLRLLPVLLVAILMNTGAGLYYNIGTRHLDFSWNTLRTGLLKAAVIAGMFIGTAYCFALTDLSVLGVSPVFILTSAITLYTGKALTSLGKILGIEIHTGENRESGSSHGSSK